MTCACGCNRELPDWFRVNQKYLNPRHKALADSHRARERRGANKGYGNRVAERICAELGK